MSDKLFMLWRGVRFEIVEEFLNGYLVWNIGRNNAPLDYIPLCRLKMVQPFDGGRSIDMDTLKLIYAPESGLWSRVMEEAGKKEIGPKQFYEIKTQVKEEQDLISRMSEKDMPF